jgi:hypothetical protein
MRQCAKAILDMNDAATASAKVTPGFKALASERFGHVMSSSSTTHGKFKIAFWSNSSKAQRASAHITLQVEPNEVHFLLKNPSIICASTGSCGTKSILSTGLSSPTWILIRRTPHASPPPSKHAGRQSFASALIKRVHMVPTLKS